MKGSDRRDRIFWLGLALERPLTESLSLAARWAFIDNRSNVDVFDYDRHVFGLHVTYRFQR